MPNFLQRKKVKKLLYLREGILRKYIKGIEVLYLDPLVYVGLIIYKRS